MSRIPKQEQAVGEQAMYGLQTAIRKLWVKSTYSENGYTTHHTQSPNLRIRHLNSTGTEQDPSLRINDRGDRFLFATPGYTCLLTRRSAEFYDILTSSALFDIGEFPYGPIGYTMTSYADVHMATDPETVQLIDLRGSWVTPNASGYVGMNYYSALYQQNQTGIELATQMAVEMQDLTRLSLAARIGQALHIGR